MRSALLVGIDHYNYLPAAPGHVEMAHALAALLDGQAASSDRQLEAIVVPSTSDGDLTGDALDDAVQEVLASCDEFWLYFAGHAEARNNDLWLLASDHDPFSRQPTGLSLRELMQRIRTSRSSGNATIILDCPDSDAVQAIPVPSGQIVMTIADVPNPERDWVTGHRDLAFSSALLKGLEGAAKDPIGQVTALSLFNYACGVLGDATRYQPLLAGRIVGRRVLRNVRGLSVDDVKQLAAAFAEEGSRVMLTPDHEWPGIAQLKDGYELAKEVIDQGYTFVSRPWGWDPDNLPRYVAEGMITQEQMERQLQQLYFQRLRDAGLLEIFAADGKQTTLFWACVGRGWVRLTPLGQHYWRMAKQGVV